MKRKILPAFSIAFLFFLFSLLTLSDYGISWDSPIHFWRGQAYWHYFVTGKKDYQDLKNATNKRSLYQNDNLSLAPFWEENDGGHPPLNGILAAATNDLLYQKLVLLGDIESHHLFIVFMSTVLVLVTCCFTQELYGMFAAIIAGLSLILYPLFLAESHFNIKDPVETTFYALSIYTFYKGIVKNSWRWMLGFAIFSGLALGTKLNIIFLPLILFPWLLLKKDKRFIKNKKILFLLSISPLIAFLIFFCSWPMLWDNPASKLLTHVFYRYKRVAWGVVYQPPEYFTSAGFNTYPFQWILYTTPLVILFFFGIGIITALFRIKKEKHTPSFLILLWFLVPIIRVSLPKMGIYGGVRQIMEYVPAMAILAGLGASQMVKWLNGQKNNHPTIQPLILFQAITLLMFLPLLIKMIKIHPNENVYFNPLIGGLKGAKERNLPDWGNTMGNVYRQAINWLNDNGEKDARLALAVSLEDAAPKIWLREDINFSSRFRSGPERKGEYVMEMTGDMNWPNFCDWVYVQNFLEPIYEIKVDDVAILTIWKNDLEHTKKDFLSENKLSLLADCLVPEEEIEED